MKKILILTIALMGVAMVTSNANAAAYKKCMSCHTFDEGGKNKMGPNLYGLLGKKAGSTKGYRYGSFLKNADFVWTEDLLREWDFNAQAMAKKAGLRTRMPALNMKGSREDEVIAFFKEHMDHDSKKHITHKKDNPIHDMKGMKHTPDSKMNPCSPSSMKGMKHTPDSKMNPCSSSSSKPIRPHAFNTAQEASTLGEKMWNDDKTLGTAGVACLSCHADYGLLNFDKNKPFPHYVKMVGDVVTLDQMINYCLLNPMGGSQLSKNSKELTAMAAYYQTYKSNYLKSH